jgi:hypothetical protein
MMMRRRRRWWWWKIWYVWYLCWYDWYGMVWVGGMMCVVVVRKREEPKTSIIEGEVVEIRGKRAEGET